MSQKNNTNLAPMQGRSDVSVMGLKLEEMVTESDLMQSWKVSKSHVRSFLSTIPHYKIGRCRRYKASDVNQFLEQHKQKTV